MRTTLAIGLWLVNLALDTTGQVAFKVAAGRPAGKHLAAWVAVMRDPWIALGLACYCVEFVTWLAFLTLVPLSIAVLLASANIVTVMMAGRIVFNEPQRPLRTIGLLLIAAGVAVVGAGGA